MAKKSLFITYLLWLFGGFFGLHHFYLGRDRQAFLYWMTFGGYFGLGWLYDIFVIRTYVADVNEDKNYMEELAKEMKENSKPVISSLRYMVQLTVGDLFGYLVTFALPSELIEERYMPLANIFIPLGVALGVHLIGNIGRHQGKFIYPLIGAYITYPLYLCGYQSIILTSLSSITAFDKFAKEWRRSPPKKRSLVKRASILSICGLLYLSMWGSFLYFNCEIISAEGQNVKCRDAAKHFFTSPMWKEFQAVLKELWHFAQHHGWQELWHHILEAFDPQGKTNALKVLGLKDSASEQEITTRYRMLSRQWHPDKHKDPTAKEAAQVKFIEIQNAYEVLSAIRAHRTAQNVKEG